MTEEQYKNLLALIIFASVLIILIIILIAMYVVTYDVKPKKIKKKEAELELFKLQKEIDEVKKKMKVDIDLNDLAIEELKNILAKKKREEDVKKLEEKYNDKEVDVQLRLSLDNGRIKDLYIGKVKVHFGTYLDVCFAYRPGNILCVDITKVVSFRDDLARVDLMILLQEKDFEE